MKPELSICMMVKNEEKNLERCLKSIQPLMEKVPSELIIVDTGSTDGTVEVAKKYTDKVYYHLWNNDFSAMRNLSISYACAEWVFILDADEEMETIDGIVTFFSKPKDPGIAGAAITGKSFTGSDTSRYGTVLTPRIFRRTPKFRYEGVVHNTPVVNGVIVDTGDSLLHYGYISTDKELMERKFERTGTLLKQELKKDPHNVYYRYQLGSTFAMHDDWKMALAEFTRAYDLICRDEALLKQHIYVPGSLMMAYVTNGITDEEVLEVGEQTLKIEPDYLDIYFFLAQIYIKRKEFSKSKAMYLNYIAKLDNFAEISTSLNPLITHYSLNAKAEALTNLAGIAYEEKDYEYAQNNCWQVVSDFAKDTAFAEHAQRLLVKIDKIKRNFANTTKLYARLLKKAEFVKTKMFEQLLEQEWNLFDEELKQDYCHAMCDVPQAYGLLNRIRCGEADIEKEMLFTRDWNKLPVYYAFVWQYSLQYWEHINDCKRYWLGLSENTILEYMKYLYDLKGQEFAEHCRNFLDSTKNANQYASIRIRKNIAKYLLFSVQDLPCYNEVFSEYIDAGKIFIQHLYNEFTVKNELVVDVKNVEEAFLLYVLLAEKAENGLQRVEYLRKALDIYPDMGRGVQILLEGLEPDDSPNEMDALVDQLLVNVHQLIETRQFDDALIALDESVKIVGNDIRFLALRAEIYKKRLEN